MSNSCGKLFKLTSFGESHGKSIGIVIEGMPSGYKINHNFIKSELARRKPGSSNLTSKRKEDDDYIILSGEKDGYTTGAALTFIIENKDIKSKDYEYIKNHPRPSHSDFPALIKYNGFNDIRGGGIFSARLTAPMVIAGAIAKDILMTKGIKIVSRIKSIYQINDIDLDSGNIKEEDLNFSDKYFPVIDKEKMEEMKNIIIKARDEENSVGGKIETFIFNLPVGLGEPLYDKLDSRLAGAIFSIPGVKAFEIGKGFGSSSLYGSENNDFYYYEKEKVKTSTNNHGGTLGGLSTSMPLVFTTGLKPTASIGLSQETVNLKTKEISELTITGRHDPCIVPRAIPVIESFAAVNILDLMLIGGFYGGI